MKKSQIITIFVLSIISLSLLVVGFILDRIKGPKFIAEKRLYAFDKVEIDKFYEEFPEIISVGEAVDVKYTYCNQIKPYSSVFVFLFKDERPKRIETLEVHFKTFQNGEEKEHIYINDYNNYYFYESLNYSKHRSKLRVLRKSFSKLIGVESPIDYKEKIEEYGKELNINEFKFIFNFSDGSNETHNIVADKEKSLKMQSYELKKSMEEIINEYKGPVNFVRYYNEDEGDINKLIINLDVQLQIYPEKGLNEIYRFFELIKSSKNRKKILENEAIFSIFPSSLLNELDVIDLEKMIDHIKKLYRDCDFEAGTTGYSSFYSMVDLVNETYESKTGKSIVTGNFRNLEMNEVLEMLDEINFN